MAELVDALDLGSSVFGRESSSLSTRTKDIKPPGLQKFGRFCASGGKSEPVAAKGLLS